MFSIKIVNIELLLVARESRNQFNYRNYNKIQLDKLLDNFEEGDVGINSDGIFKFNFAFIAQVHKITNKITSKFKYDWFHIFYSSCWYLSSLFSLLHFDFSD